MNGRWARALVTALSELGVGHYFLSPGSRSTPLAIAVFESGAPFSMHYDERGSAFAAVGFAKASRRPAAWITTSGTAVANGLPAVVEASMSNIPIVLLTSDRPPELRNTGSNQTIDQVNIFGKYVREFIDMPPPTADVSVDEPIHKAKIALRALASSSPGPVHINCMFREPLVDPDNSFPDTAAEASAIASGDWKVASPIGIPDSEDVNRLAATLGKSTRGIVVAGRLKSYDEEKAVAELAEHFGYPIFPDIQNGLRIGWPSSPNVVPNFDLLLQARRLAGNSVIDSPDVVLHFGDRMTSKYLYAFVDDSSIQQYRISASTTPVDPTRSLDSTIIGDVATTCRMLVESPVNGDRDGEQDAGTTYGETWRERSTLVNSLMEDEQGLVSDLTEPSVARVVSSLIPEESNLFLAASMPVRDMDSFARYRGHPFQVFANRGASGIDGTLGTAIGVARGNGKSTTVVIGDLAFLHDVNSLAMDSGVDAFVIVVINNDGGGIFSFLPVSSHSTYFEPLFGTPHGIHFEGAARMFDYSYSNPQTLSAFKEAYMQATLSGGKSIIEVTTDRKANVDLHRHLIKTVANGLALPG